MSTSTELAFNPSIVGDSAFITPFLAEDGGKPLTQGGPVLAFATHWYVHAYMLWNDIVNSPPAFESNGWQSCPPHLAGEARRIVFDEHFDDIYQLWPASAHLMLNRPSFDAKSLGRLSPAARWVAERLDSAHDQWPTPLRADESYSPMPSLADMHDEEAFWRTARANWKSAPSASLLSVGDLAVFQVVEAIASNSCDPVETTGRLLTLLASRHAPKGQARALKTAIARRAISDFDSIHEAVVIGQSEAIAAADIAGVSRNLLGTTPFWVSGAWRPGLVSLLETLAR